MTPKHFRVAVFAVDGSDKIACLVAGYRGKITSYKQAIAYLNSQGYTVAAYEHDPAVLTGGRPQELLDMINGIARDFAGRIEGYKKVICLGASIGAGIGFCLQRQIPQIQYGAYAGAGVSPSANIYEAPLFYFVRQKFRRNGYDAVRLRQMWDRHEIVPEKPLRRDMPFVMALGTRDAIVNYRKASHLLAAWQQAGVPIRVITRRGLGHRRIVQWFKKNLPLMLQEAEELVAPAARG